MTGWVFFYLLVFPGLLFSAVLGLLVGWVDRKVSARVQFRVGPPLFQNFNDFFKLLGKETIIVKESLHSLFVMSPLVAFGVTTLITTMLGVALFYGIGFGLAVHSLATFCCKCFSTYLPTFSFTFCCELPY